MAFGLGRLKLAPEHFWRTSPRELAAAMRAFGRGAGTEPMRRERLAGLMSAFPDG